MINQAIEKAKQGHIALWIDALVSGEFKQGRGALYKDDMYCCLGVACEVYKRETGDGEWKEMPGTDQGTVMAFKVNPPKGHENCAENGFVLPVAVALFFFGWPDTNPIGETDRNGCVGLATQNDNGKTFEEIAASIERTYLHG